MEFKKDLVFASKPSASKFVDPEVVDFAIKDLLKDRHIGTYQDLAPGGEQFLSRSRVHTPPGKGKQRIVHALCSLNEDTVKCQTTYEDLHQPPSPTALCQQQVHRPADRRYFVCTRPDLMPLVTSTQTPPHLPIIFIKSSSSLMQTCHSGRRARPEFGRSSYPL